MRKYVTKQRLSISEFLEKNSDRQFSVDMIARELCAGEKISISSIYRNLNSMLKNGSVKRFPCEDSNKFVYQYIGDNDCREHLHLKCEECGQLFHMNNRMTESIIGIARDENDFNIDNLKSVLYGKCKNCKI